MLSSLAEYSIPYLMPGLSVIIIPRSKTGLFNYQIFKWLPVERDFEYVDLRVRHGPNEGQRAQY